MLLKKVHGRDDHSRCADAALRAAVFNERLLHCMQLSFVRRNAFDRLDVATLDLSDRYQATVNNLALDSHRACAAFALATAFFGTSQVQLLAQNIEQTLHRKGMKFPVFTVNSAVDLNLVRQDSSQPALRSRRISCSQRALGLGNTSGGGQQQQDYYHNHRPERTSLFFLVHSPARQSYEANYRFARSKICEGDL